MIHGDRAGTFTMSIAIICQITFTLEEDNLNYGKEFTSCDNE